MICTLRALCLALVSGCAVLPGLGAGPAIDRHALVTRHNVTLTNADPLTPLTVGMIVVGVRGQQNLFIDEAAFQPEAAQSYGAAKHTINGGGKFIAVSSANPGWFELMVNDKMEMVA